MATLTVATKAGRSGNLKWRDAEIIAFDTSAGALLLTLPNGDEYLLNTDELLKAIEQEKDEAANELAGVGKK